MNLVYVLLLLAALVCFLVEVVGGSRPRLNLLALGLAFAVSVPLVQHLQG